MERVIDLVQMVAHVYDFVQKSKLLKAFNQRLGIELFFVDQRRMQNSSTTNKLHFNVTTTQPVSTIRT